MTATILSFLKNLPDDQSRLLLSIMITFPIGFLNNFIHGEKQRKIYGLIFGFIIQIYMYQYAALHILISSTLTLIIIKLSDRKRVGWITTIYGFTYLSLLHIYRMIYDYGGWSMDITTIMMSTVCKFSSLAFCYSDGENHNQSRYREKYAVKNFTLLEFFSYVYFYPVCLMGPFLEFADYIDYVKESNDYKDIPKIKVLKNGILRLLLGFFYAAVYLTVKPYIGISFFWENFGGKYVPDILIYYSFFFQKYRYYTAFLFAESICYVSGLSFRRVTTENNKQDSDFQKVKNINIIACETTTSLAKFFQNWNISIHLYLKRYIHFRVYDKEEDYKDSRKVTWAKSITFMVSGFWHGFYPSYYILFSHFAFFMAIEDSMVLLKKVTQSGTNYEKIALKFLEIFKCFIFFTGGCYMVGILDSLHISDMYKFMKLLYFLPSISVLCMMIIIKIWLNSRSKEIKELKKK